MSKIQTFESLRGLDPRNSRKQLNLLKKAVSLMSEILDNGLKESDIEKKSKAVEIFLKFRNTMLNDNQFLIQEILDSSPEKIKIIRAKLENDAFMEDFEKSMTVEKVYSLPSKEKNKNVN